MKEQIARYRRVDLINSLPAGGQKRIAFLCNCSKSLVSAVLNGRRSQSNVLGTNIMRLAERTCERRAR
jgi:hypothetical protein